MGEIYKNMLHRCNGFDWDEGNTDKNWFKHRVTWSECEQIFFNQPLVIQDDFAHSGKEKRYYALGSTDMRRLLFIAFTVRNNLIRVISARDMSRKERRLFSDE